MAHISLIEVPENFVELCNDVAFIKRHLIEKQNFSAQTKDSWLTIEELCEYLPDKPAKATVYAWVHQNSIPVHKGKKRLRFLKSEIDDWLKTGKKITTANLQKETDAFLSSKKRGCK